MNPLLVTLVILSAPGPQERPAEAPPRRDEWQYLTRLLTVDGFAESPPARNAGLDGAGSSFAAGKLPRGDKWTVRSARHGAIEFRLPPTGGDNPNFVPCQGQVLRVSTKRTFNVLFSLGTAHHGDHFGWVEFTFEDGTKASGPFGFSDWTGTPILGEETALALPAVGPVQQPPGGVRIWLQQTPIPSEKRIVSIRLPVTPEAQVLALTLSWRDGIRPLLRPPTPPPGPGPVAIFAEDGFPHYLVRGDMEPSRLRDAFVTAGIQASILGLPHLEDPTVLDPKRYPVLVLPYGNTFPADAEAQLRAYRKGGGAMVTLGVPFTHAVHRTPWGGWIDRGHGVDLLGHDGERAMGSGGFVSVPALDLVAQPILSEWGLDGIPWSASFPRGNDAAPYGAFAAQAIQRQSLHASDVVTPLILARGLDADPFAAIIEHKECGFAGAVDVRLGLVCPGMEHLESPLEAVTQLLVRATAHVLHGRGLLDDAAWSRIKAPVPEALRSPPEIRPVLPEPAWGWRLPAGPPCSRRVHHVNVAGLSDVEKVLLSSAQGLVHRGGAAALYLVDGEDSLKRLEGYKAEGWVDALEGAEPARVLDLVGHKRAVIVDPQVRGSLNLAVMVAATEGLLVGYPELIAPYGLEVAADLRGLFRSGAECTVWAMEHIWPRLEHRAIALVEPDPSSHAVIDYLVARGIFTAWMSSGRAASSCGASRGSEVAAVTSLMVRAPVTIPVLTFPSTVAEETGTQFLSKFGKRRVPLDGLSNLSFTAGVRGALSGETTRGAAIPDEPSQETPAPGTPRPGRPVGVEENKVYVACVIGDARAPRRPAGALSAIQEVPGILPFAGRLVPAEAFDLFPAEAARMVASLRRPQCLGSAGLGEVDFATLGIAYGSLGGSVRTLHGELTRASMKDLGQEFLVVAGQPPDGDEIAAWARTVGPAAVIFPEFRADANLRPLAAAHAVEGTLVVHAVRADFAELQADTISQGIFSKDRPAFTWCYEVPGSEGSCASEVVLVSPMELAALAREHLESAPERISLIDRGAVWKYHDRGEDLGSAWRAVEYDDSAWASGAAELGYGEDTEGRPEATVLSYGPDAQNKHMTAYFRREFTIAKTEGFVALEIEALCDDGSLIYLNGTEVGRPNMPDGDITFATPAPRAIGGSSELTWNRIEVDPSLLRAGPNVLAVEVHQSSANSSDMSFDLKLSAFARKERKQGKAEEKKAEAASSEKEL